MFWTNLICWEGFGLLVPVVFLIIFPGTEFGVEAIFQNEKYYQDHEWPKIFAAALSAVVLIPLGSYLNKREMRTIIHFDGCDMFESDHSFLLFAVEYWGVFAAICALAGVIT